MYILRDNTHSSYRRILIWNNLILLQEPATVSQLYFLVFERFMTLCLLQHSEMNLYFSFLTLQIHLI